MDQAQTLKQKGNDFLKEQKFQQAIKCYQEAIDICPPEKKEDLAIFHHNIGAVYDQMVRERERERERERRETDRERERERDRDRDREDRKRHQ